MISMENILQREIMCALGCTEPGAVALAVSKARETLGFAPDKIILQVSGNILKNAMNVGIPGTKLKGIKIAAALGSIVGKSEYGLEALKDIKEADIEAAEEMLRQGKVEVKLKEGSERLYIDVKCIKGEESAEATIKKFHTNIVYVCKNNKVIYLNESEESASKDGREYQFSLKGIYDYVEAHDAKKWSILKQVIEVNSQIADEGLKGSYGLQTGKRLMEQGSKNGKVDFQTYVASYTAAAAADARMAGCTLSVMSTSGSGNQGLTASLPVIAAAKWLKSDESKLYKALAISELVTIHVKEYIGKLSALCGCAIAASIGSACGMTYLLGGKYENLEYAVKNMIADISGLICDGIVCTDVEDAIHNLGNLGNNGMQVTDQVILEMMLSKESVF